MNRVLKKAKFLLEIGQFADTEQLLTIEMNKHSQNNEADTEIFETLAVSQALQGKMIDAAETLTHIVNASADSRINLSVAVADIGQYRWLSSLQGEPSHKIDSDFEILRDLKLFYSALDLGHHEHVDSVSSNLRTRLPEDHFILNQCSIARLFCSQQFDTPSFLESVKHELFQNFEVTFAENLIRLALRFGNDSIIQSLKNIYKETGATEHSQTTRVLCHSL